MVYNPYFLDLVFKPSFTKWVRTVRDGCYVTGILYSNDKKKKKNDLLISFSSLENPEELMVPTNHYSLSDPLNNLASPFFGSRIREYLCRICKVFPVIALEDSCVQIIGDKKTGPTLLLETNYEPNIFIFRY